MGVAAAALYGLLGVLLVGGGQTLYAAESMEDVPLYDAAAATNPPALARVLGVSLATFGVATLALAAAEALEKATVVVVSGYLVLVVSTALLTALQARNYE